MRCPWRLSFLVISRQVERVVNIMSWVMFQDSCRCSKTANMKQTAAARTTPSATTSRAQGRTTAHQAAHPVATSNVPQGGLPCLGRPCWRCLSPKDSGGTQGSLCRVANEDLVCNWLKQLWKCSAIQIQHSAAVQKLSLCLQGVRTNRSSWSCPSRCWHLILQSK